MVQLSAGGGAAAIHQTYEKWKKGVLKGTAGDLPEKAAQQKWV